jgi:hypothetical protein
MLSIRKITALILWIALSGAIISGFLWFLSRNRDISDPLDVLPESTAVILKFNSLPSFIEGMENGNKIWEALLSSGIIDEAGRMAVSLDSVFNTDPLVKSFFSREFCIAVVLKANNSPGIVFCLPETSGKQMKILLKTMNNHLPGFTQAKRRYEGHTVFDLSWKDGREVTGFSIAELNGVIAGSFSSDLTEQIVKEFEPGKGFSARKEFTSITRTAGSNVPVNIYVNYRNADHILRYLTEQSWYKQNTGLSDFASWGALDAEFFKDKIIMNGFSSLDDSINQELGVIRGQDPVEIRCPGFLPDGVSYFKVFGISDREKFTARLKKYSQNDESQKDLQSRMQEILKTCGIDLFSGITEMMNNEYGIAVMQSGNIPSPFFFMNLKSQSIAEQTFREWITIRAGREGKDPDDYILSYKLDSYNTITVFKLPVGGIPGMVFGEGFRTPSNDYFTFLNNYLVFGNSFNSLKDFIHRVVLGNTLASGNEFASLGENISSHTNLFVFAKPASLPARAGEILGESFREAVHSGKAAISKFNALSIQFSAADELVYSHIFLNYSDVLSGNVNTMWESRLDTTILQKPAIVINHLTSEKEILVQDQKDQLYLITRAGIILWKIRLDGPVMSDLLQVDYYRNGKLQYLFNTRTKIYLIDRNGNAVEKYPLELRYPATAGLSVFDYEKDGTIRICIPCEDRKIYMYDKNGKVIPGWQAGHTDNIVSKPAQYFKVGGKDYIVAIDTYKFYFFDRKGKNKIAFKKYFQVSGNNSFYLDISRGESMARLVTTDTSGSIMRVYFSGKTEKILNRKLPADHFFVFADLDGDRKGDFITAWDKNLQVLGASLDERFSTEFDDRVTFRPIVYNFSASDNKIGIVLRNRGIIYLYNDNGTLYNGFPLEGYAPFSLSSFPELGGRFNLIVGSRNNFLLNYSVK